MSGQWEVVGKKKVKAINKVVPPKNGKETSNVKKANNINVNLNDVLAKDVVKNIYTSDKKQAKPVEKPVQEQAKKPQKKAEKSQEVPKPKAPKSIESALNLVDVDEFKTILEKCKIQFPDAPIVWLKELAQFLNQKVSLEVSDPIFASRPHHYPLSMVPSAIKEVIEKATKEAGKTNVQLFFDIALTTMVTDMSKNLSALGHKIFLQYIATNYPELAVTNLSKHVALRASYQNRPNICLSLLWAVGKAGSQDFQIGLNVFQELMLPLIELKNYSRFIASYLLSLVKNAKHIPISKEQYFFIIDLVHSNKKNFPSDLKEALVLAVPDVLPQLFHKSNKEKVNVLAEFFVRKLSLNDSKQYQDCLCDFILNCFSREHSCLDAWTKYYSKDVTSSAVLLKYIDKNWNKISKTISKRSLQTALTEFSEVNSELLLKRRREEGLVEAEAAIKSLRNKMEKKKTSGTSLRTIIFFLVVAITAAVYVDCFRQGSWRESKTRAALIQAEQSEQWKKVVAKSNEAIDWADGRVEDIFPGYKQTISETWEPYGELLSDVWYTTVNFCTQLKKGINEQYPVIGESYEAYVPGLIEQSKNAVNTAWSTSVFYYNRSVDYLRKEVFVGQLSPENMQRVVIEALNTTQNKATEYYHWLYEKVQTTIK